MEFSKAAIRVCGPQCDQLGELLLPPVLKLCERTNKVFVTRAQQVLQDYLKVAPVLKTVLPRFQEAMKSSNKGLKTVVAEHFDLLLDPVSIDALKESGEAVERLLAEAMTDPTPQVRESARNAYHKLNRKCPEICQRIYDRIPPAVQKLLKDGPKTSTSAMGALKRPVAARQPAVQPAASVPSGRIGGAQRILKPAGQTDSPGLTPGSKAARVAITSGHGTPVRLKASASVADTTVAAALKPTSALATCLSACQLSTAASASAASVRAEIVQNIAAARSPDWAARHKAYEALTALVSDEAAVPHLSTSKAAAQRLFDALLTGLADNHFRVLEAVVQFAQALLACCAVALLPEAGMLDNMLARTVYLVVNPQYKGKACQEAAPALLDVFCAWLGDQWRFLTALAAAYSKPEATASVKARLLIITRIVEDLAVIPLPAAENDLLFRTRQPFIFPFSTI